MAPAPRRRRRPAVEVGATVFAACGVCYGAAVLQGATSSFTGGSVAPRDRQRSVTALQAADPEKPWKSVVFKMPKKKPERVVETDDDQYTLDMRARLKGLTLSSEDRAGKERGVNEAKIDDLVVKEADDAKINGLYTMWYIDKKNDRLKEEQERPDKHVMRKRYEEQKDKLRGLRIQSSQPKRVEEKKTEGPGFLKLQDIDEIMEQAPASPVKPRRAVPMALDPDAEEQDSEIVQYLEAMQKKAQRENKGSKRVVRSQEQKKEDYEEQKVQLYATTAALGVTGTLGFFVAAGVDAAFSFGLGSLAALSYLSGLSSYTDNADNPVGQALGGRRFLAPILLVLLVQGWDRVEARIDAVAALGLHPQLLPAILGLLMYSVGKVAQGFLPKGEKSAQS